MTSYVPIKLAYEVAEPEVRTNLNDIIFIHGMCHSRVGWTKLAKKIVDRTGRRAYLLDMRNHGDTEWSEDFSLDIMVKDVLHFMDEKDIKQAVLIGQSMGAKISMDVALAQPERVEKIIPEDFGPGELSDSAIGMVKAYLPIMKKAIEMLPPDVSYQEAKKMIMEFALKSIPEEMRENVKSMNQDPDSVELPLTKRGGRYALKSNIDFIEKWVLTEGAFRASKGLCTKPALFIYGMLSPFKINEQEELIMKLFPNAKLHGVEGASHAVHNDRPDEFCQAVFKFLSEK